MSCPAQPSPSQAMFPGLKGMGWKEWCDLRLRWHNLEHPPKQVAQGQSSKIPSAPQAHGLEQALQLYQLRPFSECGQWKMENSSFFRKHDGLGAVGWEKRCSDWPWHNVPPSWTPARGCKQPQAIWVRGLWLFYINLHYRTVWHLYLSSFSWGLRLAWLKTIEKFSL